MVQLNSRCRGVLWAVVGSTTLIVGCGLGNQPEGGGATDAASELLSDAARTAESVVSTVRDNFGFGAPPASPSHEGAAEEAPAPAAPATPARRAAPRDSVSQPDPVPAPIQPAPEPLIAPVDESASTIVEAVVEHEVVPLSETVTVVERDYTVYSSTDSDVEPPVSPMPTQLRPWRTESTGTRASVEVVVASDGSVEKVRLLSTSNWTDMMLLSHIKMWQFEPARKAGEPVRYQMRLESPIVAP